MTVTRSRSVSLYPPRYCGGIRPGEDESKD